MNQPSHANNFNLLRLVFAALVVYSHAYGLMALEEPAAWGRSLGNLSVHGFFVISGYLIYESYERSSSTWIFLAHRFLRIAPGLAVALIVTKHIAKWCGGFVSNPVPYIANGPVWTLTWEVVCYGLLALLGVLGILNPIAYAAFFASVCVWYLTNLGDTSHAFTIIAPLIMMFMIGAMFKASKDRITFAKNPIIPLLGLAVIYDAAVFAKVCAWITGNVPFLWGPNLDVSQVRHIVYMMCFPWAVIYIGAHMKRHLPLKHDISYGVYIYSWPMAQLLMFTALQRGMSWTPGPYFLCTMLATAPLAYASWRLVEKPAIRLKKIFDRPTKPHALT